MRTTKFYIYDQKIPAGAKVPENFRRQISFSEALTLDDQLAESLRVLEATFSSVKKEFEEKDAEAILAAQEVLALKVAGSPRLAEAQKVLEKIKSERDAPMKAYQIRHSEISLSREALTRPLIVDQLEDWRNRRISLSAGIEVTQQEEEQVLFGKSKFVIKSNRAAIRRVLDFLLEKESKLRGMDKTSLREISKFIKEVEAEFSKFDPTLMEAESLSEGELKIVLEAEREVKESVQNPETAYATGGKDYKGAKEFIRPRR